MKIIRTSCVVFSALVLLCYSGGALLAQEIAEQAVGVDEPNATYLEQTQPEILDWIRTTAPDAMTAELQIKVASMIIRLFEADQIGELLAYFGGIGSDDLVPLLTEPGGPLTTLSSDVAVGAVTGLMVDVGAELAAEALFRTPVLSEMPETFRNPLEIATAAALTETFSIVTHDGPLETLILVKVLERAQDAIEIYQATGALARAERGALIAVALMVGSAAEIGVDIGGERGQRLIDLARRDIAPVMPAAVGDDDAKVVTAMFNAALDALVSYHQGDQAAATSAYQAVLAAAGEDNLGPLSLLRNPMDWGVAAMNMGRDSPEIALYVLLEMTELNALEQGRMPISGNLAASDGIIGEPIDLETSNPVAQPSAPSLNPVRSPLGGATLDISAGYFDASYPAAWSPPAQHLGTDLPAVDGTQVVSPVSGTVLLNRTDRVDAFEKYLIIRSASDGHEHVFGHINSLLSEGDAVEVGTPLGTIVSAGTGPHVHWGINTNGVLESLGSGWGWGRAPLSATVEQAAGRGWIDPAVWFKMIQGSLSQDEMLEVETTQSPNSITNDGATEWGPSIVAPSNHDVWGLAFDSDAVPYIDRIKATGLPLDAIEFSAAYAEASPWNDEVLATNFEELGTVDLVFVAPGIDPGTTDRWRAPAYVNGDFGVEITAPIIRDLSSTFPDGTSQSMLAQNPTASAVYTGVLHRQLPSGAQRFIEVTDLTGGCRVCDSVGAAIRFVDFSIEGRLVSRRPIGLVDNAASEGFDVGAEGWAGVSFVSNMKALQYRLNMLGYEAGAMDGFAGPQTRQALMEFQVEHCLTPTGQPDGPTVRGLAIANGLTAPCAGESLPNGLSANTPLLAGVYVSDPQICSSSTGRLEVYTLLSRTDDGSGMVENLFFTTDEGSEPLDGGCQTSRTDIIDGFTRVRGSCLGEEGVTQPLDEVRNIEANDRFIILGAGQQETWGRCSNSSPLGLLHSLDTSNSVIQTSQANGLQGCAPSGLPGFPERMKPVEDSSTHLGRTASGNNWVLQLSSLGLDFGDSQFTNSSGTTVDGLWRTTDTGICQSYNDQQSWSCHDIFACEGDTNRFLMRNSEGEFTSVIEASVGPSYELGNSVEGGGDLAENAQYESPSATPIRREDIEVFDIAGVGYSEIAAIAVHSGFPTTEILPRPNMNSFEGRRRAGEMNDALSDILSSVGTLNDPIMVLNDFPILIGSYDFSTNIQNICVPSFFNFSSDQGLTAMRLQIGYSPEFSVPTRSCFGAGYSMGGDLELPDLIPSFFTNSVLSIPMRNESRGAAFDELVRDQGAYLEFSCTHFQNGTSRSGMTLVCSVVEFKIVSRYDIDLIVYRFDYDNSVWDISYPGLP